MQLGATDLCKDDVEREIKIEFFKSVSSGKHKILGSIDNMTLGQLKEGKAEYPLQKCKTNSALTCSNLKVDR